MDADNNMNCDCTSCLIGKVRQGILCKDNCDSEFYNNSGLCSSCSPACKTCRTSSAFCTSCRSANESIDSTPRYLYNNECFIKCPPGFYRRADLTCQPCITNCKITFDKNKFHRTVYS